VGFVCRLVAQWRVGLATALTFGLLSSPAWAQTGSVTGTVRHAPSGTPVPGVTVTLVDPEGYITYHAATTDASGRYQILRVPAGRYFAFTANSLGLTNEVYDNLLCLGGCATGIGGLDSPASPMCFGCLSGTPILVAEGATSSGRDFGLDLGGSIAGVVTAADTGNPLTGVSVSLSLASLDGAGDSATALSADTASALTDANGAYIIRGLPAGRYYAATGGPPPGYLNEIYDNLHCGQAWSCSGIEGGTPIEVALGATSGGRNFSLERGGRITGIVTDAATLAPVPGACVNAYRRDPLTTRILFAGWGCADATGAYEVQGLVSGGHYATVPSFSSGHVTALYDGLTCVSWECDLENATEIPVTLGETTSGRNFTLEIGGVIRGVVTDQSTSAGLSYPQVRVFRRVGGTRLEGVSSTISNPSGEYEVRSLPPGTYFAYTVRGGYANEIFDNIPCPTDADCEPLLMTTGTPITVNGGGAITSGIDFGIVPLTGPPAAPHGLRAFAAYDRVLIAWEPPTFGPAVTGYLLEAGVAPGTTAVTASTTMSPYQVSGIVAPGRYYVRVRARNSFGLGPPSEELPVDVYSPASPLQAPSSPSAWMSGRRLTLTWGQAATGGEPTGYLVEAGTATGRSDIGSALVTGRFFTYDPVPDGFYFLRVRAVRGAERSRPSIEIMLNVGGVPAPPGAPAALSFAVDGTTVNLSWMAPAEGAPTSYVLEAGSEPGLANLVSQCTGSSATSLSYADVPPGTYYVRVRAVNSLGAGVASNEVVVTVP
jgi:hypothetical protein